MESRDAGGQLLATPHSRRRGVLWIAAIALIYFGTARASLLLGFEPAGIAAIWPPAGLFLSAILLTRRDLRPLLVGVLCATDFVADWLAGTPLLVSGIYALAGSAEAVLGSWLLLRFVGPSFGFARVRDVIGWLLLSVLLANALTAVVPAVASMSLPGAHSFWRSWQFWAASDGVGNLLVTPFVLGWVGWMRTRSGASRRTRAIEASAMFGILALLVFVVFARLADHRLFALFLPYVVFPFLTWAALRLEARGVATAMLIVAAVAVRYAAAGAVPSFSFAPGVLDDVVVVQAFLAVTAVPALLLAAVVTERRESDAARLAGEDRFRRAIVESPLPVILHAEDGAILQTSRSWLELTGYAPEELRTIAEWTERAYGDRKELVRAGIDALYALDHRTYESDYAIRTKDGTTRVWEFSSAPLGRLPDGRRLVMSMALDVTERRLAETEAARAAREWQTTFDATNDALWVLDKDQRILRSNAMAGTMFHRTPAEMIGQHCWGIAHGTAEPCPACPTRLARQSGRRERTRLWDGDRCLEVLVDPILDATGQYAGAVHIVTDVTERERADETLRRSEGKYRDLVENINDVLFTVSPDGIITYISSPVRHLAGYEPDELVGRRFAEVVHPDDLSELAVRILEVQRNQVGSSEFRYLAKDGTFRWARASSRLILEGDHPAGIRGLLTDITDRKRAEEEKAGLEAQLRQAQKMESVGRLAGGVAHDFNNMLGVILGHVGFALEQLAPAQPLRDDLEAIRSAATRSAELTRQLLAFARRQTIAPRVMDMNDAVAGAVPMLQRLIGEEINLRWRPKADLWPVLMDPSQIDQILTNLCVNARDAISGIGNVTIITGERTLTAEYCAAHRGSTPGDHVLLAVSDDGCGMNSEVLSHLFEPFFTTKSTGQGTGLGLATVYGIVKQNNGSIDVNSEPGRGTTFTIYLPRHVGGAVHGRAPSPTGPGSRGQETILLVEDEPAILKLAARMLTLQGYTVLAAGRPGEAIRLAREHAGEIDLLMTDVVMPEMNGQELTLTLLSFYPRLKRLFMSGYTADVIAERGALDDRVHFIQKPFSIDTLAAKVREALDSEDVEET